MQDAVLQAVRRDQPCIVELCRELCRISTVNPYSGDSHPAGELRGQEFLATRLRELGGRVSTVMCPADIYARMGVLGPRNRNFAGRPNVVAEWDFGRPGPRIILNGHMDTVGVEGMTIDPFGAEVRDGRIWSRGASDCKGGLTVAVSALDAVLHCGATLRGSVVLESVVDEECNGSGAGTLACLDAGYTGDMAIFVDGKRDAIVLGCSGCLTADVHVEGKEGHAAYGTGVSALEKALVVKGAIDRFKRDREAARPNARVNLGIFRAGVHPAVVPGSAYLSLNVVYEVDEAAAAQRRTGVWGAAPLRDDFERRIRAVEAGDDWLREHPSRIEWVKDLIPFSMPEDLVLASKLAHAHQDATGKSAAYEHMVGWTDACYYAALAGIPTVLYGPARHGAAHTADESVEIDALVEATAGLALFLLRELSA
jgi:acetylornithine deacetylase